MELWEACFFVLIVRLAFGKDTASVKYEIRKIDSCPVEGYFFKRDPSPNRLSPGPCWLCFCQENGTATCWQRNQRRCDVEKFHHHRVGRHSNRYRRSFSDIFFRDGTRDFFNKNLPVQCKPNQSFSNGCPPADWCIGCTVCDCDSNGRWDCHILSFCDGKEKKKKVKPQYKKPSRNKPDNNYSKKIRPTKKPTRKPYIKPTTKAPTKNMKKVIRANIPKNNKHLGNQPNKNKATNANYKLNQNKIQPKKTNSNPKTSNKMYSKPIQIRGRPQNKSKSKKSAQNQKNHKNNASNVKIIKRVVATRKPIQLLHNAVKGLKINPNNNDTVKIGQKIIKQVLTAFQKIMRKEMDKIEKEHRQRLADGIDCGKHSKRDKRTYNERSKAAARNKNKYNKSALVKENYTNARYKREIITNDPFNLEKVSVITLSTEVNAVIPLDTHTGNLSIPTNSSENVTTTSIFTPPANDYYKYIVKNSTTLSSTTEKIVKNNESYIADNFVMPSEYNNNISQIIDEVLNEDNVTVKINTSQYDIDNNTEAINPDFNDLKFDKWHVVKLEKDERKKSVTRILLSKYRTTESVRDIVTTDTYYTNPIPRNSSSKYHTSRRYNSETFHYSKMYSMQNTNKTDITGLKHILGSLFAEMNKTKVKSHKKRQKLKSKVNILKSVRNFFHNLFSKKRPIGHKIYGLGTQQDHTLQILCENVGPCKIKKNNKLILKYKLYQLNKETKTVLKSIRTVKGLLHLLELPKKEKTRNASRNATFQSDVQKLGVVLRDYANDDINTTLTFTQKTQIDYIKKMTQTFIDSVKKFADILTDILKIITPPAQNDVSTDLRYQHLSIEKKNHVNKTEHKLHKIKDILFKYNIMQNTFMKKMYALINGEEKTTSTTEKSRILASYKNDNNSTDDVIEKYSKNIIDSLRRLKNIVQILSSKRKKRELTMKDNALDYLLMMMEFLIQHNNPLDRVPDHDGIDLLIDAIKNAPEIKPINKEDIYYKTNDSSTNKINNKPESSEQYTSDSHSDSNRISNEENQPELYHNQDNDLREATYSKLEDPALLAIEDDVTQKVYYRVFNDNTDSYNEFESTRKSISNETEKVGFDKFESFVGDPKKYEVYTSYIEDEHIGDSTTDNSIVLIKADSSNVTYQHSDKQKIKTENSDQHTPRNQQMESSSESQEFVRDKKTKLDWIEETFDREIKEFSKLTSNASKRNPTRTSALPIVSSSTANNIENISQQSFSKEEGNGKRVAKNTSKTKNHSDDVMYKKQMLFLNSLDYGTEKSVDFEESDSKDYIKSDGEEATYFI